MAKFTKRYTVSLTPDPAGNVVDWESDVSGFGVRAKPTGRTNLGVGRYFAIALCSKFC